MAVKASNQTTLIDLTDGYSVVLTNDNYTFLGTTNSVSGTQTTTSVIQALCGSEVVPCSVGKIEAPTGLSIVSDGKSPSPTLTITATSALTQSGSVVIPVTIGEVVISKTFSYSIAFKGTNGSNGTSVTVKSTSVTYQASASGTVTPSGEWLPNVPSVPVGQFLWTKTVVTYSDGKSKSTSVTYQASASGTVTPSGEWLPNVPSVPVGQFLWTKTVVTYSDGKSTTAYSVSRNGNNGTSVTITKQEVTYQAGDSGTSAPTGTWGATVPTVAPGKFLWTKTVVTYSDGKSTTSYSVSRQGANGQNGADALSLVILSSNGTI